MIDVKYVREVRDDLLMRMEWLDERHAGLGTVNLTTVCSSESIDHWVSSKIAAKLIDNDPFAIQNRMR